MVNREILNECPWCFSENKKSWGRVVRNFKAVVCEGCGLIYIENRLNSDGLKEYYKNYLSIIHQDNKQEIQDRWKMYILENRHITNYISQGKILDIGCSGGYFLDTFDKDSFQCVGVEFGEEEAKIAKNKYKVYYGNFDNIQIQEKFDLIIFRGVIEHIPYPKNYLDKAVSLLNDGGYIYITSTPDSDAFCCDLFKENWNQHEPEAHLMHFNQFHFRDYFNGKKLEHVDVKHFYRSTPYCNIENDILKVAEAINLKNNGELIKHKSPAFYGNMMSIIYKKIAMQ